MGCYSSFVIVIHRTASSSALHHVACAPACVPADFYGASALLPLTDDEIVQRLKSHIETCEPGFKDATVIDSAVLRFPKAVTHFSPGSYPSRPYQVTGIPNCFLAGDWVKGVSSLGLLCGTTSTGREPAWCWGSLCVCAAAAGQYSTAGLKLLMCHPACNASRKSF